MAIELPVKAPGDRVDYPINWTNLLATGEAVASIDAVTITPAGDLVVEGQTVASPRTTIVLSGGVEWKTYLIRLQVSTDAGSPVRQFDRYFCLCVRAV
jgi:hypothetical protein